MRNNYKLYSKLGIRIYEKMQDKDRSIDDIADLIGVTPGHLRRLLNGDCEFRERYLVQIAEYLDADIDYLRTGKKYITTQAGKEDFTIRLIEDINYLFRLPDNERKVCLLIVLDTIKELFNN